MIEPIIEGDNGLLYYGDCLEGMSLIPSNSVDMILCDLPYGTTACAWDSVIPLDKLWTQYARIAKKKAAIVLTASQPFTAQLVMSNPKNFKHEWIWQKSRGSNFACTKFQPMKEHESILVFSYDSPTYFPIMQERNGSGKERIKYVHNPCNTGKREVYNGLKVKDSVMGSTLRVPSSIQKFNNEVGLHPTQKPVALFEYLIKTYTKEGDIVLDTCAGSGTTGIACLNTKRKYILIEKELTYVKVIKNRIETLSSINGKSSKTEDNNP